MHTKVKEQGTDQTSLYYTVVGGGGGSIHGGPKVTKGHVKLETIGAPKLLRSFFKGSEVNISRVRHDIHDIHRHHMFTEHGSVYRQISFPWTKQQKHSLMQRSFAAIMSIEFFPVKASFDVVLVSGWLTAAARLGFPFHQCEALSGPCVAIFDTIPTFLDFYLTLV